MAATVWEMTCSVEAEVSLAAAWKFWTTVANWSDPPSTFELEGPFAAGSRGITRAPGQEPRHWTIRELEPFRGGVIDMPLDGAVFSAEWGFAAISPDRTRLTQRVSLSGDNAAHFAPLLEEAMRDNLPAGMRRIAGLMASHQASASSQ